MVDVLEEFLLPQVVEGVPGEPFEGRIDECEPPLHVVGDDPFTHGCGYRLQLALDFGCGALSPPPPLAFPPEQAQEQNQQSEQRAACEEEGAGKLDQRDHESEDTPSPHTRRGGIRPPAGVGRLERWRPIQGYPTLPRWPSWTPSGTALPS